MTDIDHIRLIPETPGWKIRILVYHDDGSTTVHEFGVGDVIQFYEEVERTLGKWLADGPADFHGAASDQHESDLREAARLASGYLWEGSVGNARAVLDAALGDPDLARDIERGK